MSVQAREKSKEIESAESRPVEKLSVTPALASWLLVAATFLVFGNSILVNGFVYDDNTHILKNQLIRDIKNIPTLLTTETWFWRYQQDKDPDKQPGPTTPYYRPVFNLVLVAEWQLFRDWAPGWHFGNVLMHMGVVLLVFMLLRKVTGDLALSVISTALFAVHPLRSESVAWICGLSDVLLALLILPSFYFYLLYRERRRLKYLAGSLGFYLLAVFAKEPALALLIFIGAYELFIADTGERVRDRIRPLAFRLSGFVLISVLYFVARHQALGFWLNDSKFVRHGIAEQLLTIPLVIWKYIGLLFLPVNLSLFHGTPLVSSPLSLRFILPLVGLIGLGVLLWRLRKSMVARFAVLWLVVHLLPVLNLGAFDPNFLVQERYVYIPSIGFSLLIGMLLLKLPLERWLPFGRRRAVQAAIMTLLCLVLAGKAFAQNTVWKDDETLFTHGAQSAPNDLMSHFVLGFFYIRQPEQQPDKVVREFERYVDLDPKNPIVLGNLATAHLQMYEKTFDRGHVDRAIALCEKSLKLDSANAEAWDTLGHAYSYDTERKNYDRARSYFMQALRIEPRMSLAAFHMGATYLKEHKFDEAVRYLEAARQQQPDFPDTHIFLGYAYANRGQIKEGIDSLNEFLRLRPDSVQAPKIEELIIKLTARLGGTEIPDDSVPVGTITVPPAEPPPQPEKP